MSVDGQRVLGDSAPEDPRFGFEFMRRTAQTLASRLNATRLQLLKTSGHMFPQVQFESD